MGDGGIRVSWVTRGLVGLLAGEHTTCCYLVPSSSSSLYLYLYLYSSSSSSSYYSHLTTHH